VSGHELKIDYSGGGFSGVVQYYGLFPEKYQDGVDQNA